MFERIFENYPFFRVIPAILMMAVLFRLSASPSVGEGWLVAPWDKVVHATAYACLSWCYALWWNKDVWTEKTISRIAIVVILCSLYGASDEFHQSFVPGRCMDILDWVADTTGALVGASVYAAIIRKILNK